jgi:serine/threonine protein kinase
MPLRVERFLGRGTYGTVFKVYDTETMKFYAAKLVVFSLCEARRGITPAEYDILFRLRHTHLANAIRPLTFDEIRTIFNVPDWMIKDELGNLLRFERGILMPLAQGDLSSLLSMKVKPDWYNPIWIAWQIFRGVEALYDSGYYHLDIKPANVLYDENHTFMISDFGLSLDRSVKTIDHLTVTLTHRPPEVEGESYYATQFIDVFSLGVILNNLFVQKRLDWYPGMTDDVYIHDNIIVINNACNGWKNGIHMRMTYLQDPNIVTKSKDQVRAQLADYSKQWSGIGTKGIETLCDLIKKMISIIPVDRGTIRDARQIIETYVPENIIYERVINNLDFTPEPVAFKLPSPITTINMQIWSFLINVSLYQYEDMPARVPFAAFQLYSMSTVAHTDPVFGRHAIVAIAALTIAGDIHSYNINLYEVLRPLTKLLGLSYSYDTLVNIICKTRDELEQDPMVAGQFNASNPFDACTTFDDALLLTRDAVKFEQLYTQSQGAFILSNNKDLKLNWNAFVR